MSDHPSKERATLSDTLGRMPNPDGSRLVEVFERGDVTVELYAPRGTDDQVPHDRDEIYFVVSGEGYFVSGESRQRFHPGDFLFVPAGEIHRFEDFTDDFATWVVFLPPGE